MCEVQICQCQQCAERQRIDAEGLAEIELLRRDAERYRWLRDEAKMRFKPAGSTSVAKTASETDSAIDSAMGFRWDHTGDGSSKHA